MAEEKDETGEGVNGADKEEGGEGALDGLGLGIGFWYCGGPRGIGVVWIVGVTRRGRPVGWGDGLGCVFGGLLWNGKICSSKRTSLEMYVRPDEMWRHLYPL